MAKVLYSTHYALDSGSIWSWRIAGLFQVKEDPEDCFSAEAFVSPSLDYTNYAQMSPFMPAPSLDDYDEARYWPHP